jgi:hypothetical protein
MDTRHDCDVEDHKGGLYKNHDNSDLSRECLETPYDQKCLHANILPAHHVKQSSSGT